MMSHRVQPAVILLLLVAFILTVSSLAQIIDGQQRPAATPGTPARSSELTKGS